MIGLDKEIDSLRASIQSRLTSVNGYISYGRAYLNKRREPDRTVPEVLIAGSTEYKEVLLDSGITGLSFIVADDDYESIGATQLKTDVDIYFAVNLKKMYPLVTERAVEYLHRDVLKILNGTKFSHQGVVLKDPFSEFSMKIGDNMQPFYLVRFETEIEFNVKQC